MDRSDPYGFKHRYRSKPIYAYAILIEKKVNKKWVIISTFKIFQIKDYSSPRDARVAAANSLRLLKSNKPRNAE